MDYNKMDYTLYTVTKYVNCQLESFVFLLNTIEHSHGGKK